VLVKLTVLHETQEREMLRSSDSPSVAPRSSAGSNVSAAPDEPGQCDKHSDERLKLYCLDCKTMVCAICYIEGHTKHRFVRADDIRTTIKNEANDLKKGMQKCRELVSPLTPIL
jgi:B-box zinc finger